MSKKTIKTLFKIIKILTYIFVFSIVIYFISLDWLVANLDFEFPDLFMLMLFVVIVLILVLSLICLPGTWQFYKQNKKDEFWTTKFYDLLPIILVSACIAYAILLVLFS